MITRTCYGVAHEIAGAMPVSTPTNRINEIYESLKQLHEIEKCKTDPVYFISNYLYVSEPRGEYEIGWKKFDLWPRQIEFIAALQEAYHNNHYIAVEKCRDVGATYTALGYALWHWLFTPGYICVLGSRKEEEVDKQKDKKKGTLFAKLDGFIKNLPPWFLPKGKDRYGNQQAFSYEKDRGHLILYNPVNEASFVGEAMNPNFGRSNRASQVILDEYAASDDDVFGHVLHVCKFIVVISTIQDEGDQFHRLTERAKKQNRFFVFDWTDNPGHDQAWFDDTRESTDELKFAREVLRDYTAIRAGLVYPNFKEVPIEEFDYNPEFPLVTLADYGYDGTWIGFLQRDPETKELYLLSEIFNQQTDIEYFIPFIPYSKPVVNNPYVYSPALDERMLEHRRWKKPILDIGDLSAKQRHMNAIDTVEGVLRRHGVRIRLNTKYYQDMAHRTSTGRQTLKRLVKVHPRCEVFIRSMRRYRYPDIKPGSNRTNGNEKPVHDENSHACTAWEYFAISENLLDQMELAEQRQLVLQNQPTITNPWNFKI